MTTPTPAPKTRPITYHPIERHWYRLADFAQGTWHRFDDSRTGTVIIWIMVHVVWLLLRALMILVAASIVVGFMVLYITLSACLGGGALNKAANKAR